MIAIYPIHPRDEELALENAKWWNELGGCKAHDIFVFHDQRVTNIDALIRELTPCFKNVFVQKAGANVDGWPDGANYMFRTTVGVLASKPYQYFLWMEPDAAPLKENWMDILEKEHLSKGRPFTGGRVEGEYNGKPVPIHMTGVAIYSNPLYAHAGEAYRAFDVAWDIAAKDQIVPKANFTSMFCHGWRHPGFKSLSELITIPENAIIYHGVKDLSLITLLRQKRSGNVAIHSEKEPALSAASSPAPPPPFMTPVAEGGDVFFHHTNDQRPADLPPPGIHLLPGDVWVLEGDMISGVIKEKGRLDADELLPKILPYIKPGMTVVDGGAFVGDHAVAYSNTVGDKGMVYSFEPNPRAFACLKHNTARVHNIRCFEMALGEDVFDGATLVVDPKHAGGAYIGESATPQFVQVTKLDVTGINPDVIKLDLEGYELNALKGAEKTINKHHPVLIVEINDEALARQGATPAEVLDWIRGHAYEIKVVHDCSSKIQLYDVVAVPVTGVKTESSATTEPTTVPARTSLEEIGDRPPRPYENRMPENFNAKEVVEVLRKYAEQHKENRRYVLRLIRKAGLISRQPSNTYKELRGIGR